jgi:hypothetical protein
MEIQLNQDQQLDHMPKKEGQNYKKKEKDLMLMLLEDIMVAYHKKVWEMPELMLMEKLLLVDQVVIMTH